MKSKKNKQKKGKDAFVIVGLILLTLYTISFLIPLAWGYLTSLKNELEFMNDRFGLPNSFFNFDNYKTALSSMSVPIMENGVKYIIYMPEMFYNSMVYAILCTLTHTFTPCITAYAVVKYNFKLGKLLYSIVIVTMIFPIVGGLASEIQVAKLVGAYDSFIGLAIMKGHFLGVNFLIFYAAFKGMGNEYGEAARIDGASEFKVMTSIMLPLAKTTIMAIALLSFISYWNDYGTALVYLPTKPTIAYGLYYFNNSSGNESNFVTVRIAGCMLVSAPILVVFILLKDKLVGNLTLGGIKG